MSFFFSFYRALSKRERIAFLISSACFAFGILGFGIALFFNKTVAVPAAGGSYTEGMVGQPSFVNPVLAKSSADKSLTRLLFANLTDMADGIDIADGGRTIKVRLKEGLTWSDGQEITSDDVAFTVDQIKDPDADSPLAQAWQGIAANRVSKLEIDFKLPQPYAFFSDTLSALRPIPKHLYAEIPPANWKLSDYNTRPVASGDYIFASRQVGSDGFISSYRLRANPHSAAGTPLLSELDLYFYRNPDELVKAFNSGAVEGFFSTDPSELKNVQRPYRATDFSSPTYYAVFWNQSASVPLAENAVRTALRLATVSYAVKEKALDSGGEVSSDPLSPSFFPPTESTTSIDQANALLDKVGWKLGNDGVRTKKSKKADIRLEFTLTVPDLAFLNTAADELTAEWLKIGVKANVERMPLDSLVAGPIKDRTYQALLFGNTLTPSGDLFSFWHSTERIYPGLNLALYQNRTADKLIESIRTEPDRTKRMQKMDSLRTMIANDNPALFLFSPVSVYVTGKDLGGIKPIMITDAADRFQSVGGWYIATKRVLR